MYNLSNILFIISSIIGMILLFYFSINIYDFYVVQKEHTSKIFFKDKSYFICALMILLYMIIKEITPTGLIIFLILLFASFIYNLVIFSKESVLLFNNKIRYENVELITLDDTNSKTKKLVSIKIKNNNKLFKLYLNQGNIDFLINNFELKHVEIAIHK